MLSGECIKDALEDLLDFHGLRENQFLKRYFLQWRQMHCCIMRLMYKINTAIFSGNRFYWIFLSHFSYIPIDCSGANAKFISNVGNCFKFAL